MIWVKDILAAAAIVLWIAVLWSASSIISHEVQGWHVAVMP